MHPVNVPARIARVAVVPGSPVGEAWAIGFSYAHLPGADQITFAGQAVFLRYTRQTDWQVQGMPLDASGKPLNMGIGSLALASNGEGWAVGQGSLFHHLPGAGPWKAAASPTKNSLYSVSLARDGAGVYGYAVGSALTFLKLDASGWTLDVANGSVSPGSAVPDLISVSAVSRDNAWAVAGAQQLQVFQRTSQGWAKKVTGNPIFDTPPAPLVSTGGTGTVNQYARATAVSARQDGAWFTGVMQPVDDTRPPGSDQIAPDQTRPFALRYDAAKDAFTAYCPRIYQVSSSGVSSTIEVCDKPFPFGIGELPALSILPGGDVMAGGFGLFRFHRGTWTRQPNVAGFLVSAAFASAAEGWLAGSTDAFTGLGFATGSSFTLGHWTTETPMPHMRRWPEPSTQPLFSVGVSPDGSGSAMAVGGNGTILRLSPGIGWDVDRTPTDETLFGLAWTQPNEAWAVGRHGTILHYDGTRWTKDETVTNNDLTSVAFASPALGWAVGANGAILEYSAGTWHVDPASGRLSKRRLSAVGVAGSDVIVAGEHGQVLVRAGRGWKEQAGLEKLLASGQDASAPNLLSVAGLPDGTAFVGGARSVLLERAPGASFMLSKRPPIEGAIHTLVATRDARGGVRLIASAGTRATARYGGPGIVEPSGWLFAMDSAGWHDIGQGRAAATHSDFDAPAGRDAVYGIAIDPNGAGWAVGGGVPDLVDEDGHQRTTPSGSVWRISAGGTPETAPSVDDTPLSGPAGATSFAFLSDTSCAGGLCSPIEGAASSGDAIMVTALRQIDEAAANGVVSFVTLGGDLRRNGLPDELAPVRDLLSDLRVPAFAAIGDKDLFSGVQSSFAPDVGTQQGGVLPSAGYYLTTFADRDAPWGSHKAPSQFTPVHLSTDASPRAGQARTHYAFDYRGDGTTPIRLVVLDTSQVPLATNSQNQNPQEDQTAWLQNVLLSARNAGLPTIVVMHQPLVVPVSSDSDATALTGILTAGGALGVLAGHDNRNRLLMAPSQGAPGAFVMGVFGSGGAPLAGKALEESGAYHAWQLVTIEKNSGAATIHIRSIPVLESVALSATDGRSTTAGGTLRFRGLGRAPDTGWSHAQGPRPDADQSRATYLRFPLPRRCALLETPAEGTCVAADAAVPDYKFSCVDMSICTFVGEDPQHPGRPARTADGSLVTDASSGLMCALHPGTTSVVLRSGATGAKVPVTVRSGQGDCIRGRIDEPVAAVAPSAPHEAPAQQPVRTAADPISPKFAPLPAVVAVPVPPVNPVPAPPGAPGVGRKEEHEVSVEEQGHSEHKFTAHHAFTARSREPDPVDAAWPILGAAMLLAFMGACAAAAARERAKPAHHYVRR